MFYLDFSGLKHWNKDLCAYCTIGKPFVLISKNGTFYYSVILQGTDRKKVPVCDSMRAICMINGIVWLIFPPSPSFSVFRLIWKPTWLLLWRSSERGLAARWRLLWLTGRGNQPIHHATLLLPWAVKMLLVLTWTFVFRVSRSKSLFI